MRADYRLQIMDYWSEAEIPHEVRDRLQMMDCG